MAQIKNLIFDMGNVLLRYDPEEMLENLCETDDERAVIRRALFQSEIWQMGDAGTIAEQDKYAVIAPNVTPQYRPALKRCCEHWGDFMKPLPGAVSFCRAAKEHGYHLFVLSNASDAFLSIFPREMPMELFDGCVYSAGVKLVKPDVRIFQHLLEKYSLNAEECLFLDDVEENTAGARKAGMQTVCFTGDYKTLREELLLCGV